LYLTEVHRARQPKRGWVVAGKWLKTMWAFYYNGD